MKEVVVKLTSWKLNKKYKCPECATVMRLEKGKYICDKCPLQVQFVMDF